MPAFREQAIRYVPRSVSDTVDGDNSPSGAMASMQNLIWSPDSPGVLVCRPANLRLTTFSGLSSPGVVSAAYQLDGVIYGMIASDSPTGKDRPFAYTVASNSFKTVNGITSANCPTTPATTGAWNPPMMDMVGTRIIVTHPGFNYAGGYAFGYFDLSGFSATITADNTSGSPTINGNFSIAGIGPGYTITGTGIPASTTIKNTGNVSITTTGTTHSNTTIDAIPSTTGMFVGQAITGVGIPTGTTIAGISSGVAITISQAATASATVSIFVTGTTLTLSANASSSNNAITFTIAGGTVATPLWCAGNTTGALQLAGIPQCVHQFNNRAYFAQANFLVFTDTLSLNISNAGTVQVLTVSDTSNIVALMGLPFYTTSGGTLQAILAFKSNSIWQVTGDAATNNLLLNQLSESVGTQAARSVAPTPQGVFFMAVDGIRKITITGDVSEPDADLAVPFIYAVTPSRVSGGFNGDIYRICVQNGNVLGTPFQEYYYHCKFGSWTGPHTFRQDLAARFSNDFIVFNTAVPASMWQSFAVQNHNAEGNTFVENGTQLTWVYQTCPMSQQGNMYANGLVRSTLEMALDATGNVFAFQGFDENNGVLAQATIKAPLSQAVWNAFNWGDGTLWGAQQFGLEPLTIPWTQPLNFNKLVIQAQGNSSLGLRLGAVFIGYEPLGFLRQ